MIFSTHGEQISSYPNVVKQAYGYAKHGKYVKKEFESKAL